MPTNLPPRQRRSAPDPDEHAKDGDFLVPMLIICTLLFANGALFYEKFYPALEGYTLASSPPEIQLSP
jgi:hypothetical protein